MGRWIISWTGLKSGSFRFLRNQSTPGRRTCLQTRFQVRHLEYYKLFVNSQCVIVTCWISPCYLSKQKDERGKVEDVDHADQPVEEHRCTRSRVKTLLPVFQGGVKHFLQSTKGQGAWSVFFIVMTRTDENLFLEFGQMNRIWEFVFSNRTSTNFLHQLHSVCFVSH